MVQKRYLIRLANIANYSNKDSPSLSARVKQTVGNPRVKAANLRVSNRAVEFDLFADSDEDAEDAVLKLEGMGKMITFRKLVTGTASSRTKEEILQEAKMLFNEERFWEVHEALEEVWRRETGSERELLQGLILFAAAYVHLQKARSSSVLPVLRRALNKISASGLDRYDGFDLMLMKRMGESFLQTGKLIPFQLGS